MPKKSPNAIMNGGRQNTLCENNASDMWCGGSAADAPPLAGSQPFGRDVDGPTAGSGADCGVLDPMSEVERRAGPSSCSVCPLFSAGEPVLEELLTTALGIVAEFRGEILPLELS